jgi:hypothetical protein
MREPIAGDDNKDASDSEMDSDDTSDSDYTESSSEEDDSDSDSGIGMSDDEEEKVAATAGPSGRKSDKAKASSGSRPEAMKTQGQSPSMNGVHNFPERYQGQLW